MPLYHRVDNLKRWLHGARAFFQRSRLEVALLRAVRKNDVPRLKALLAGNQWPLDQGIRLSPLSFDSVSRSGEEGRTLLHVATACGHWEVAEELLVQGAKAEVFSTFGVSPMTIAAERGDENLMSLLAVFGGDLQRKIPGHSTFEVDSFFMPTAEQAYWQKSGKPYQGDAYAKRKAQRLGQAWRQSTAPSKPARF